MSIRRDVEEHERHPFGWWSFLWPILFLPVAVYAVVMFALGKWQDGRCFKCKHDRTLHHRACSYHRADAGGGKWTKGQANYNAEYRCTCRFYLGPP